MLNVEKNRKKFVSMKRVSFLTVALLSVFANVSFKRVWLYAKKYKMINVSSILHIVRWLVNLLWLSTMANREEEGFVETFKEHLKKNFYDVTWSAFMRRDQSSLSQNEHKVIFDKFVRALLILSSITYDTPNKCVDFFDIMDELRVHIEALDID